MYRTQVRTKRVLTPKGPVAPPARLIMERVSALSCLLAYTLSSDMFLFGVYTKIAVMSPAETPATIKVAIHPPKICTKKTSSQWVIPGPQTTTPANSERPHNKTQLKNKNILVSGSVCCQPKPCSLATCARYAIKACSSSYTP